MIKLGGIMCTSLCDLGSGNSFLVMTPNTQANREKVHTYDFTKMKHVHALKDNVREWKTVHRMGENICKSRS